MSQICNETVALGQNLLSRDSTLLRATKKHL